MSAHLGQIGAAWDLAKLRGELEAAQKAASANAAEAAQFKKDSVAKIAEVVKLRNELAAAYRQAAERRRRSRD